MLVVSHVNLLHSTYSCLQLSKKMITDERTFTFLTTADVVLEEYNNCRPNNK